MKLGLALSVQHLPTEPQAVRFREHVEQVRVARAAGFDSVGTNPKDRAGRLVEGLAVIERLWTGEPVTYEGTHFRVRDVSPPG